MIPPALSCRLETAGCSAYVDLPSSPITSFPRSSKHCLILKELPLVNRTLYENRISPGILGTGRSDLPPSHSLRFGSMNSAYFAAVCTLHTPRYWKCHIATAISFDD